MLRIPNEKADRLHTSLMKLGIAHKYSSHDSKMEAFAFQSAPDRVKALSRYLKMVIDEDLKVYDLENGWHK